ncbi:MAG: NFACT family protein [Acutalibacteraceae bacterium]
MALDGITLNFLKNEIKEVALLSKVSQIYQPNKEELIFTLRTRKFGNKKLLLSCRADSPRIHFTEHAPENPASPPMLCMLLRKKLTGGTLTDVRQNNTERILFLDFSCLNEIGDKVLYTVAVEIMGKYSNVILIGEDSIIVDSLKRVDFTMSRERAVLPNLKYELPPPQDKLCILKNDPKKILSRIKFYEKETTLYKAFLSSIEGISPIVARELAEKVNSGENISDVLQKFCDDILKGRSTKTIILKEDSTPFDFSFMDINQYGDFLSKKYFHTFSEMLDSFYSEKDLLQRIKIKSSDIHKTLTNTIEKLRRKILIQEKELLECEKRENLRIKGDLLQANLYRCPKGASFIDVENFYNNNEILRIELNPAKSPAINAQRFYKNYQKAKNGEKILTEQISKAKKEIAYLESVLDNLDRAESIKDIASIKEELSDGGYIKRVNSNKKRQSETLPPREYETKNGFKILVGRNNRQNDVLTLRTASKNDLWFHTKDIPGSHTILFTDGKTPKDEDIIEASSISAYHSKGKNGDNVPVDYTMVKYVSKPKGAKPGMVIYINNRTVFVTPKLPQNK